MANQSGDRTSELKRQTSETNVSVKVNLDGTGRASIDTAVGFFDHMLELFSRHSLIDIEVKAQGDLKVDAHHTVEDVGLVMGQAIDRALGDKRGIQRYGWAMVPMDESLAQVAVDLSGRPALVYRVAFKGDLVGMFPVELVQEFFKALSNAARMNLHVTVPYGDNNHHVAEAMFKALARALRTAVSIDPRMAQEVPSTKGSLA